MVPCAARGRFKTVEEFGCGAFRGRAFFRRDDLISGSLEFRRNPPQRPLQIEDADKKARELSTLIT